MDYWWEYNLVPLFWKLFGVLKLNTDIVYNLAILTLGIYPTVLHRYIHRILHVRRLTAALFTVANYWKQPKCP